MNPWYINEEGQRIGRPDDRFNSKVVITPLNILEPHGDIPTSWWEFKAMIRHQIAELNYELRFAFR